MHLDRIDVGQTFPNSSNREGANGWERMDSCPQPPGELGEQSFKRLLQFGRSKLWGGPPWIGGIRACNATLPVYCDAKLRE